MARAEHKALRSFLLGCIHGSVINKEFPMKIEKVEVVPDGEGDPDHLRVTSFSGRVWEISVEEVT